jgi:hypothetical protein
MLSHPSDHLGRLALRSDGMHNEGLSPLLSGRALWQPSCVRAVGAVQQ